MELYKNTTYRLISVLFRIQKNVFISIIISILLICRVQGQSFQPVPGDNAIIKNGVGLSKPLISADTFDFQKIIQDDTTFFAAFRNLRFAGYDFSNELHFRTNNSAPDARYKSVNRQYYVDSCRSMKILREYENLNFYSDGDYRYYTAKMYDSLFYTNLSICGEKRYKPLIDLSAKKSRADYYMDQLKMLIFSPGIGSDIPLIGDKTAIFNKDLIDYYDISVTSGYFDGDIPIYIFSAEIKPDLTEGKSKNLVIRDIVSYFDATNFQVLSRKYHVKYNSWFFDFDVKMAISIQKIGEKYYPKIISYDGYWDLIGIKEERGKFKIEFYNF